MISNHRQTSKHRQYDILVYGATGFTGRLVVRNLVNRYSDSELTWAIGGRNESKLKGIIDSEKVPDRVGVFVADSEDRDALREAVSQARVVLNAAGPYAKYGSSVVAACADLGVHYCDLTGEVYWMRRMIDAYDDAARTSGACIIHACGFDSVPSDVGTYLLQKEMKDRHGVPASHVKLRVRTMKGGFSGGTIDSMMTMMSEAATDPSIAKVTADPYALDPENGKRGPDGADRMLPTYDSDFRAWTGPFVMGVINTRVVRRTNALLGYAYGTNFHYDEATLMRRGPLGLIGASASGVGLGGMNTMAGWSPTRGLLQRFLPRPGEGPSAEAIESGFFDIRMLAKHPTDPAHNLRLCVRGDKDPGYGSTSKMITECAIALAHGVADGKHGFWTPASALGDVLLKRLPENAGVTFDLDHD